MTLISFSPDWFYGYDVALEIGFAITALIIALFAFSIYRATDQKQVRVFGFAFLLISCSYVLQSALNFLVVTNADHYVCSGLGFTSLDLFGTYGIYAHMVLMTAGLTLLTYMTFRIEKLLVLWIMLALAFIAIFMGANPLHSFFLISTILLAIILWHFMRNYIETRQTKTLLVVLAFVFLLFGSLHFILSVDHELYYAIGHVLELFAYVLILANLYLVLHGKKT